MKGYYYPHFRYMVVIYVRAPFDPVQHNPPTLRNLNDLFGAREGSLGMLSLSFYVQDVLQHPF